MSPTWQPPALRGPRQEPLQAASSALKAQIAEGSTWGWAASETYLGYVELVGEQPWGKVAGVGASSILGCRSRDAARSGGTHLSPFTRRSVGLGRKRDKRPELEVERSGLYWSCASRLCHLHPWRFAGPERTKPWAAGSDSRADPAGAGGPTRDPWDPFSPELLCSNFFSFYDIFLWGHIACRCTLCGCW